MNCIVTGGSGFIGSHICAALQESGQQVVNLDLRSANSDIRCVATDIRDVEQLTSAFTLHSAETVFHVAAVANARQSLDDPLATVDINIRGTAAVLEAARRCKVRRVFLASTVWFYNAVEQGVNGNPRILDESCTIRPSGGGHVYTTSKIASEILCHDYQRLYNLDFTILRYGIPYGPGMWPGLALRSFLDNSFRGQAIRIFGDGSAVRRFVFVKDLARAHVLALSPKACNQTYNLEGDRDVTIRELAETVGKFIPNTRIEYIEDPARRGELKVETGTVVSNQKAKKELGWQLNTSLEEGVRETVEWYRKCILNRA